MGRCLRILLATLVLVLICFGGWVAIYPSASDPKNFRYVFWKAGLHTLKTDVALGVMVHDADRDKLVVGKTRTQLQERFGLLSKPSEVSQYYRECHETTIWKGRDVLFLSHGPWMVVFDGDNAADLVLCKGY